MDKKSIEKLRKESNSFSKKCKLTEFLYYLMRDHVTPGTVEGIMTENTGDDCNYTNGWLARYAENVAERLNPRNN